MVGTWISAAISIALFIGFIQGAWGNGVLMWRAYRQREDVPVPPLPLIPGAMGAWACLLFPFYPLVPWRWVPLILDFGCVPAFCFFAWHDARASRREFALTNPRLLVAELNQEIPGELRLSGQLYANGQARLEMVNTDPRPYWDSKRNWIKVAYEGTWSESDDRLVLRLGTLEVHYQRISDSSYRWISSNRHCELDEIPLEKSEPQKKRLAKQKAR